ncbi:cell wall hydrolase [Paracoccus sp. Z118]|uniref:cell wall hydrolase n=1 Tax=Paracoccus sp. Z118 TaxID=2851017 RepID=UPI001C2BB76A|nr:cell wall hydrolase [Paracoccus sp. Z118]MBV0890598.1 cell wall hydrolase [Paracoccus sp. Z118]
MPKFVSWLARLCVCAAIAAPVLSTPVNAESGDGVSYQERVQQYQRRNAERLQQNRAAATGPERLIQAKAAPGIDSRELGCMTEAIYFESRGEPVSGQRAVAEVILNRVDDPRFPRSVCGVVNQKGQFSYKGNVGKIRKGAAYNTALHIATEALSGAPRVLTDGATYFHTHRVNPSWSRKFTRTTRIGAHIFYRQGARRVASN